MANLPRKTRRAAAKDTMHLPGMAPQHVPQIDRRLAKLKRALGKYGSLPAGALERQPTGKTVPGQPAAPAQQAEMAIPERPKQGTAAKPLRPVRRMRSHIVPSGGAEEFRLSAAPPGKISFEERNLDVVAHELSFEPPGLRERLRSRGMAYKAAMSLHGFLDRKLTQRRGLGPAERERMARERDFLAELLRRYMPKQE